MHIARLIKFRQPLRNRRHYTWRCTRGDHNVDHHHTAPIITQHATPITHANGREQLGELFIANWTTNACVWDNGARSSWIDMLRIYAPCVAYRLTLLLYAFAVVRRSEVGLGTSFTFSINIISYALANDFKLILSLKV